MLFRIFSKTGNGGWAHWEPGLAVSSGPDLAPCFSHPADLYSEEPGQEEPAWVQTERQQFRDFRDLNKDGKLDGSEVGHWVLPPAQDQPLVEANHLLHDSDTDKVGTRHFAQGWSGLAMGFPRTPTPIPGKTGAGNLGASLRAGVGPLQGPRSPPPPWQDGRLSKAEILGNWNMFVGSQATNYGEDLTRHHDEL